MSRAVALAVSPCPAHTLSSSVAASTPTSDSRAGRLSIAAMSRDAPRGAEVVLCAVWATCSRSAQRRLACRAAARRRGRRRTSLRATGTSQFVDRGGPDAGAGGGAEAADLVQPVAAASWGCWPPQLLRSAGTISLLRGVRPTHCVKARQARARGAEGAACHSGAAVTWRNAIPAEEAMLPAATQTPSARPIPCAAADRHSCCKLAWRATASSLAASGRSEGQRERQRPRPRQSPTP